MAMRFLKALLKLINEVATLGGASRLEEAKKSYEDAFRELQARIDQANSYKANINAAIDAVGIAITRVKPQLNLAERMVRSRFIGKRDINFAPTIEVLLKVEKINADISTAFSVGVGSIAGGSLAVGAWAMVAMFGSATTGAAISGLPGIAATNATLAWFGGGALAAGGAGMAGGMTVLGGFVAVPLVYIAAKGTHKQAKAFEDAKAKVEVDILDVEAQLTTLPKLVAVIEARQRQTEQLCTELIARILELKRVIRPFGALSAIKQTIFLALGRERYSDVQVTAIAEMTTLLAEFVAWFESNASPVHVTNVGLPR